MSELRFAFGENWQSFSTLIDEERISESEKQLTSLLGGRLDGLSFLDIGCGSGIHAMAALKIGASRVVAIDADPKSVSATTRTLGEAKNAVVRQDDILTMRPGETFDVVYSWGVLHHTGDMAAAIRNAAAHVKPGGRLAIALYGETPWCWLWKPIKRLYLRSSPARRGFMESCYVYAFGAYLLLRGKTLTSHKAGYQKKRGMDFMHDVRDWLGGYPYESIKPSTLESMLAELGFVLGWKKTKRRSGLFGSGNDEYLFRNAS